MATDSTSTVSSPGIVLYDVAFAPPVKQNTCAPNPWKARYALNFKDVACSTHWVQMTEITKVRQSLGVPPCRKFADGTDFYTLPIVTDSKTGSAIGDSFEIADYLENTYPDAGAGKLFPSQQLDYVCRKAVELQIPLSERNDSIHPDYAHFNANVDMAFTLHVQLTAQGMPLDLKVEDAIKAEFARRFGVASWDDIGISDEAREDMKVSFRDTLHDLAVMFQRDTTGPFMSGSQASYADIIVGGWLRMLSKALPENEWKEFQGWHDGVFGKLHAALQQRFGEVR